MSLIEVIFKSLMSSLSCFAVSNFSFFSCSSFLKFSFSHLCSELSLWWKLEKIRKYLPLSNYYGRLKSIPLYHYGAKPSCHRNASECNPASVLVRAYITPWTRLKPLILPFVHRKGGTPNISRTAQNYLYRCLLCSDPPVTGLKLPLKCCRHKSFHPFKRTELTIWNV